MALVLTVQLFEVVDIGPTWIAVLSIDSPRTATVITSSGEKARLHSNYETEMAPDVWVQLGPSTRKLQLLIEAPKEIPITLRRLTH